MKADIHPKYFTEVTVVCSCGNTFVTGSTKQQIHVEVCYKCHPLYTGEKRYVDTLGQVGKFEKKQQIASQFKAVKTSEKKKKESVKQPPKSLRELLMSN
jgi:large subunit ribosomal protein L31